MIDLTRESPIRLADVPKLRWLRDVRKKMCLDERRDQELQPSGRVQHGRRLHVATVYRWATRGVRGRRLEYVQLGGTRVTTEAALLRFFESLTAESTGAQARQSDGRTRHLDQVDRALDAAGL